MKTQLLIGCVLLGTLMAGQAAIYYQGTTVAGGINLGSVANSTIVDGNPANVIANTMDLTSYAAGNNWSLTTLTLTLNISGGNNNGLYAYLVGPNGGAVTLMNRPGYADGFGATGAGMNITLSDAGSTSIQSETSGAVLGGTYQAAGSLSYFNNSNPNGTWTLYFADTILGGGDATLNGWSLEVTAVPEPVNVALGVFGLGVIGLGAIRCYRGPRNGTSQSSSLAD